MSVPAPQSLTLVNVWRLSKASNTTRNRNARFTMIGQSKRPLAAVATSALLLGSTLGALAADLPYGGSYDQSTVSGAVYDWTGFYGGVHGGYGRGSGGSTDLGGFIGGFQGGYSMQQGQF